MCLHAFLWTLSKFWLVPFFRLLTIFVYASPHSSTFLKFQFLFVYFVMVVVAMSKMEAWCHRLLAQLHMELNDNNENDWVVQNLLLQIRLN
jgi:hypothetical protein